MRKHSFLLAVAIVVCGFDGGSPAYGQGVDYGSLQDLFGEPITTNAIGTPQRVSEVPANMTIITADDIRQSGSRNIPEILSRVPGLDVLEEANNSYDIGVRGYQQVFQPRLLVLVDGRQVFIDDYSRTIWGNIPVNIDDIRQIEVVKGAASALFGSNAAGGVINIITYSPVFDKNRVANITVGTQDTRSSDGTVTYGGDFGGTKFSLGGYSAREFNTPRYDLDGNPPETYDPIHRYIANSTVVRLNPKFSINTEMNYSKSVENVGEPMDWYTMGGEKAKTAALRMGVNWESPYGLITNNNYWNYTHTDLYESYGYGNPYTYTTNLYVSQLQDQFKVGSEHTLRFGTEYRRLDFENGGVGLLTFNPKLLENIYSVNGMWHWQINNNVSWINAARFDSQNMEQTGTVWEFATHQPGDYSRANNVWSANSAMRYTPTPIDSFRLSYGRGVQLPSLIQTGSNVVQSYGSLTNLGDYEGNPFLKPTIVQDYSFDYTRMVVPLLSAIKVGVFYETNRDVVMSYAVRNGYVTPTGIDYQFGEAINAGNSSAYGGEIQIKGKSDEGYRWDASYSFSRVTDSDVVWQTTAEPIAPYVNYQGSAPQHHVRLLLGYTSGAWEFDAKTDYQSSTNMNRSQDGGCTFSPLATDGYVKAGGRIGYAITDSTTAAVSGTGVNKSTIQQSAWPAVERKIFFSLTQKF